MPVFTLSTLATVAGKSPDTMRDWFDRGFFGEAGRRTPGGQRRVRAASADKAVAAARLRAKGYERHRPSKDEKFARDFVAKMKRIEKIIKVGLTDWDKVVPARAVAHLLDRTTRILLERTDDQLEDLGLPPGPVNDWLWGTALSRETVRRVLISSLAAWMREVGSTSPTQLAGAIGVSRRTLGRRLGHYMGAAVSASGLSVQSEVHTKAFDHKSGRYVPTVMSEHATPSDLRHWASMCNYRQRSTVVASMGSEDRFDDSED
jgi:hypothetical protein